MKNVWISVSIVFILIIVGIVLSVSMNIQKEKEVDVLKASIDQIVFGNYLLSSAQMTDEQFTEDLLGELTLGYFYGLDEKTTLVGVRKTGTLLVVDPAVDFLNSQEYHFNDKGELVKYISISSNIDGQIGYYFDNNKLLTREYTLGDEDVDYFEYEDENVILKRANVLYDMFMKDNKAFTD